MLFGLVFSLAEAINIVAGDALGSATSGLWGLIQEKLFNDKLRASFKATVNQMGSLDDAARLAIGALVSSKAFIAMLRKAPGSITDPVMAPGNEALESLNDSQRGELEHRLGDALAVSVFQSLPLPQALGLRIVDAHGRAIRAHLDVLTKKVEDVASRITTATTAPEVTDPDVVAVIRSYLLIRSLDWDVRPLWLDKQDRGGRTLQRLSRKLQVVTQGDASVEMSEEEALEGAALLVVLGGPGSGKTWLSRRYAIAAAEKALAQLDDGVRLDAIEVPIWTMWAAWADTQDRSEEGVVAALIHSSFKSMLGLRDLPQAGRLLNQIMDKLKFLLVVDSMDEAHLDFSSGRLDSLSGLGHGRRVVTTSRQSDGLGALGGRQRQDDPRHIERVVVLKALSYPEDVESFIDLWFEYDKTSSQNLKHQIKQRRDLQEMAETPLLLAFLCLLNDTPVGCDEPGSLPSKRYHLYEQVAKRLIDTKCEQGASPDHANVHRCMELLTDWAGDVAQQDDCATGLSMWDDDMIGWTVDAEPTAVDNVAPLVGTNEHGDPVRRFIHRSMMEHFVARYVVNLPTSRAVDILLPHLWYDPGWSYAAPAAIANHPRHDELLSTLLERSKSEVDDACHIEAAHQIDQLFFVIADESEPSSWQQPQQAIIGAVLPRAVTQRPLTDQMLLWLKSDGRRTQEAIDVTSRALLQAGPSEMAGLVKVLVQLAEAPVSRQYASEAINVVLPQADPWVVADLVEVPVRLEDTPASRQEAIELIGIALPQAGPWVAVRLVDVLARLADTPGSRQQAIELISIALPQADARGLADLVKVMVRLADTPASRQHAIELISSVLPQAEPWAVADLVKALMQLADTPTPSQQAIELIKFVLPQAKPRVVAALVEALVRLADTPRSRQQASETINAVLPKADPQVAADLVEMLVWLDDSPMSRQQAIQLIGTVLPLDGRRGTERLVEALVRLADTPASRQQAIELIGTVLPQADARGLADIVKALVQLADTPASRQQAIELIRSVMSQAGPRDEVRLVEALVRLADTPASRQQASEAIYAVLPNAVPRVVADLVEALILLNDTPASRQQAIKLIGTVLPPDDLRDTERLMEALVQMADTPASRQQAIELIGTVLPRAEARGLADFSEALMRLADTPVFRQKAIELINSVLPQAAPWETGRLVESLVRLNDTSASRQKAIATISTVLPPDDAWVVGHLLEVLVRLADTPASRQQASETIYAVLPQAVPRVVADLVEVLIRLADTPASRQQAAAAIGAVFFQADAQVVARLVVMLVRLANTPESRQQAIELISAVLPQADPWGAVGLQEALVRLAKTSAHRQQAVDALLLHLHAEPHSSYLPQTISSLRKVMTSAQWLEWLHTGRSSTDDIRL